MKIGLKQVFAISLLVSGCAGSPAHTKFIAPKAISETLEAWEGRSIQEAVNRYGPPSNVSEVSGEEYYKWENTSGAGFCKWWFKVNDKKVINKYGWQGHPSQCYGYIK